MSSVNVECPYCGSLNVKKTAKGKLTRGIAQVGGVLGGAVASTLVGAAGVSLSGLLVRKLALETGYHQYYCQDCCEVFKAKLDTFGMAKKIKKYDER